VSASELIAEGARVMRICNSCRYCEGYCAVFPAMERRMRFNAADLNYMANLCHQCAECYYACQYAPPHEFAINVPKVLAQIRVQSYKEYAWPAPFARAFERSGTVIALALAGAFALALFGAAKLAGPDGLFAVSPGGNFYQLIPHEVMAVLFSAAGLFSALALAIGFVRAWREWGEGSAAFFQTQPLGAALRDVLRLEYMRSGGVGCTYPDQHHSNQRWWFHHFTFYGFLFCFASTLVAAIYHYVFRWSAPYAYFSLPVILGTLGGVGLVIGPIGLRAVKARRDPAIESREQTALDSPFSYLLLLTSVTGLLLLSLRQSAWMGPLLFLHLGIVLALFVTLPYGKFVHGIYRSAALVRYAIERKRPAAGVEG
jgi:citrate/tricarballylate utilization protein